MAEQQTTAQKFANSQTPNGLKPVDTVVQKKASGLELVDGKIVVPEGIKDLKAGTYDITWTPQGRPMSISPNPQSPNATVLLSVFEIAEQ
jgi:hypothetical protein